MLSQKLCYYVVAASNAFNTQNHKAATQYSQPQCSTCHNVNQLLQGECSAVCWRRNTTLIRGDHTRDALPWLCTPLAYSPWSTNSNLSAPSKQVLFADDATAGEQLHWPLEWWTKQCNQRPSFGHFANPSKMLLIVKEPHLPIAMELLAGTGVSIMTDGRQHWGSPLGPRPFVYNYVRIRVNKWVASINLQK